MHDAELVILGNSFDVVIFFAHQANDGGLLVDAKVHVRRVRVVKPVLLLDDLDDDLPIGQTKVLLVEAEAVLSFSLVERRGGR